jgi:hypothetical protein
MPRIQFDFTIPASQLDQTHRPTFVEDVNRALDLVAGHFDSSFVFRHVNQPSGSSVSVAKTLG